MSGRDSERGDRFAGTDSTSQFVRVKKLKGQGIVLKAAKHNLREIASEAGVGLGGKIDPTRSALNVVLHGPSEAKAVAREATELMRQAGLGRLRKDGVYALEVIMSLPVNCAPPDKFFEAAADWCAVFFDVPILSATVHLDEAAPHCHVLLLPLVQGRMNGSKLMGNIGKLRRMQESFHENVAAKHGLSIGRSSSGARTFGWKRECSVAIVAEMTSDPGIIRDSDVSKALVTRISENPEPLLHAIRRLKDRRVDREKSFAGIMTRPTYKTPIQR